MRLQSVTRCVCSLFREKIGLVRIYLPCSLFGITSSQSLNSESWKSWIRVSSQNPEAVSNQNRHSESQIRIVNQSHRSYESECQIRIMNQSLISESWIRLTEVMNQSLKSEPLIRVSIQNPESEFQIRVLNLCLESRIIVMNKIHKTAEPSGFADVPQYNYKWIKQYDVPFFNIHQKNDHCQLITVV